VRKTIGIIPARYGSSRFPGKALALIAGKSMIQRTYENACGFGVLDSVVVTTDDERIADHVRDFGGKVVMTSRECTTGTDRIAEAIKRDPSLDGDIIVNIQGDEPCLSPETVAAVVKRLDDDADAVMATAVVPLKSERDADDPNIVKCVMNDRGRALYFSRSRIPSQGPVFGHLGLYAFHKDFLLLYATLPPTPLQQAESLEQLKALEHGYTIAVAIVDEAPLGVDVPADIAKVEEQLLTIQTT